MWYILSEVFTKIGYNLEIILNKEFKYNLF